LRGHCKTPLPEVAAVTASTQVPVDQVKIWPGPGIGPECARQSLSRTDILPADLYSDIVIRRSPYHIFIKRIFRQPNIANGLYGSPNRGRTAEVADIGDHCLPPINPLLGTQDTYVVLSLRIRQMRRLSDVGYVIG